MGTKTYRARTTNSRRSHLVATTFAVLAALGGAAAIGIGLYAWSMDRPPPTQVLAGESVTVGRTPLFDKGLTLFAAPSRAEVPADPTTLGCTLHREGLSTPLRTKASIDELGTRVVAQLSLAPAVTVGPTGAEDRVSCDGPAMEDTVVWLLPTTAGPSRTPLSTVIGGIALLGVAALVDPRARGLKRGLF